VGVVGAIIPWNYPLVLAMDALTTALFAGNALVLKPSEFTPLTALMLPGLCVEAGLPEGLVQIVTGDARTGQALVRGGVDKILFTGSGASARSVMAAASESLTPVTMELGGKDPAIVLDDADLDRAARGVAFGAFFNAGQTCLSIERALVERSVYEAFCQRLVDVVGRLRVHPAPDSDVGPMITDMQRVVVTGQIQEALAGGARSLTGGLPDENAAALSPTLLVDVTDHMTVMNEETFGPVLCIVPVADETEAIRRANEGRFGLFASVWTGDVARGLRVGRALRAGGISINDSLSHYGVAALPMGGVGESGFGRRRGAEGLLDLTRTRSVLVDRLGLSREPWWFPYDDQGLRLMRTVLTLRARGPWKALLSLFRRSPSGGPR
jgi:acyl-CoA reductase-like NAD-dependent aldehyde dehydrogenase